MAVEKVKVCETSCGNKLLLSDKKGNGIIIHPEALLNQASGFFSKSKLPPNQ